MDTLPGVRLHHLVPVGEARYQAELSGVAYERYPRTVKGKLSNILKGAWISAFLAKNL
jgi:hypothetical protein